MRLNWLSLGLALMAFALPARAQELVGTSIVNGRPVQMMSDFTWKYATAIAADCQPVQGGVSFCGQSQGWTRVSVANKDVTSTFRLNDRSYGLFIVEQLGTEDGMTREVMRSAILQNAAASSGVQPKDVMVFGVESTVIEGFAAETISYQVKASGMAVVFTNTVVMDKHRAVQVATYGIGQTLTDEMKANHKQFLAATRFK